MDFDFFIQRLNAITDYQTRFFYKKKEILKYQEEVSKLAEMLLRYHELGYTPVDTFKAVVDGYEKTIKSRKYFYQSTRVLEQACRDVRDVLESFRAFEGMEGFRFLRAVGNEYGS